MIRCFSSYLVIKLKNYITTWDRLDTRASWDSSCNEQFHACLRLLGCLFVHLWQMLLFYIQQMDVPNLIARYSKTSTWRIVCVHGWRWVYGYYLAIIYYTSTTSRFLCDLAKPRHHYRARFSPPSLKHQWPLACSPSQCSKRRHLFPFLAFKRSNKCHSRANKNHSSIWTD